MFRAIVVILLCISIARADEAEDRAEKYVKDLRGGVVRDEKSSEKPVVEVYLRFTSFGDAGAKELVALKNLKKLSLWDTAITDAGLKDISALKQLVRLDLSNTKVTDSGLGHLIAMKELKILILDDTKLTDQGLKAVARIKSLRTLQLGGTAVSDAGLKELAALPKLQELYLFETAITGAGLSALNQVELLFLEHSKVSDKGLVEIGKLKQLTWLSVQHCPDVTDEGIKELGSLTKLKSLYLNGTKATKQGIAKLRMAIPDCEIEPKD